MTITEDSHLLKDRHDEQFPWYVAREVDEIREFWKARVQELEKELAKAKGEVWAKRSVLGICLHEFRKLGDPEMASGFPETPVEDMVEMIQKALASAPVAEDKMPETWCQICYDRVDEHDDEGWGHKANDPSLLAAIIAAHQPKTPQCPQRDASCPV